MSNLTFTPALPATAPATPHIDAANPTTDIRISVEAYKAIRTVFQVIEQAALIVFVTVITQLVVVTSIELYAGATLLNVVIVAMNFFGPFTAVLSLGLYVGATHFEAIIRSLRFTDVFDNYIADLEPEVINEFGSKEEFFMNTGYYSMHLETSLFSRLTAYLNSNTNQNDYNRLVLNSFITLYEGCNYAVKIHNDSTLKELLTAANQNGCLDELIVLLNTCNSLLSLSDTELLLDGFSDESLAKVRGDLNSSLTFRSSIETSTPIARGFTRTPATRAPVSTGGLTLTS